MYGTLPGHPEAGQEQFLLEHLDDERISLTIEAYSRPASTLAKLGGPISGAAQDLMTRRYLRALDRLEAEPLPERAARQAAECRTSPSRLGHRVALG